VRPTTAPAPGGRGWFGLVGAIRRPGSSGVRHGGPPSQMRARAASRPMFTPAFSPAFLSLSPNRIVPAAPTPGRSPRRLAPAATRRGAGHVGVPVIQADGGRLTAPRMRSAVHPGVHLTVPPKPVTRCGHDHPFVHLTVPGRGSPTVRADDHLIVLWADCSPPELLAVHVGVPRAHSRQLRRARASGGRRWWA
jgi:hypothetical protein